jgi:short-subunit dehydrogenase
VRILNIDQAPLIPSSDKRLPLSKESDMALKEAFTGGAAVITGAGSGIGEGIARVAASLGMKVALADVAADRIQRVAADINDQGGQAVALPTDVTDRHALERLADSAYDAFGDVTLLVNNAGIESIGFIWETPAETWDKLLGINVLGVVHGTRIFAPRMLKSPKQTYIANVASIGGLGMMPSQAPYTMSKHAVLSFSECLYLEMQLQEKPVSVSAVLPGPVATRIFEDAPTGNDVAFAQRQRNVMHSVITQGGITPLEAAKIILEGVAARHFWVSTHPEILAGMAKARADYLANLATPALADAARQILQS